LPSNFDELFDQEPGSDSLLEREERCQKAMKAVFKAIFMRAVICGLLLWILFAAPMELWVMGLLALVLLINITGTLPLVSEWKKRRKEWKALLEEEE